MQVCGGNADHNIQDNKSLSVQQPTVLGTAWKTVPTYIGVPSVLRVTGLHDGEAVTAVSSEVEPYRSSIDADLVTFVPGGTSQTVTVRTSAGREAAFPVTAVKPVLASANNPIAVAVDGQYVQNRVYYTDPDDGSEIANSVFDATFFNAYLTPSLSLAMVSPSSSGLVSYVQTGSATHMVYAYDISKINYSPGYDTKVATLSVKPKSYTGIVGLDIPVSIMSPVPYSSRYPIGTVHDFNLIPGTGAIDADYLASLGYNRSIEYSWTCPPDMTVLPSSITGFSGGGVDVETGDAAGGAYPLKVTPTVGSAETSCSVRITIGNIRSHQTVTATILTCTKVFHLAVGGVRSSLIVDAGYPQGYHFTAAADFASNYKGTETNRFSDWPSTAKTLRGKLMSGGTYAKCISNQAASQALDQKGGVTYVRLEADGSAYGIRNPLYGVYYYSAADAKGGGTSHLYYDTIVPYFTLRTYNSNVTLVDAVTELELDGYVIHDYGKLYPDSNGWLVQANCGYSL